MHGAWTHGQDIVIVALRLGTNYNWTQIEREFNRWFPQAPAQRKDIESRYNKTLKLQRNAEGRGKIAEVIDDYRHYRTLNGVSAEHIEWINAVLRVLRYYTEDRVIAENPQIEGPVQLQGNEQRQSQEQGEEWQPQIEGQTGHQVASAYMGHGLPDGVQGDPFHSGLQDSNENQFIQQSEEHLERAAEEQVPGWNEEGTRVEYDASMGFMDMFEGELRYVEAEGEGAEGRWRVVRN